MPSEHLTPDEIGQYLARKLETAALLAMEDHLEVCPECRSARQEAAGQPVVFVPFLAEEQPIHLTEEEVAAQAAASRRWRMPWMAIAAAVALAAGASAWWVARREQNVAPVIQASLMDGGRRIELDAAGGLRGVAGFSADQQEWVREALRRGEIARGAGPAASASESLRSVGDGGAEFQVVAPVDQRVLSDRPEFAWQPVAGASGYEVLVTNPELEPLARSGRITSPHWQATAALPRGVPLLWQVRAYRGASFDTAPKPPAPPARFEIADQATADAIAGLRSAPQPSHLLLAIVCARGGLVSEARRELEALQVENPGSAVVRRWEESLSGQPK